MNRVSFAFFRSFLGLTIIFPSLVGCFSSTQVAPPPPAKVALISETLPHYSASGKILLATQGEKNSGDLEFSLSSNLEGRLQIFVPVLGTLLYEIRVDPQQFMMLDYREKAYWLDANVALVREDWLGMDLTLEELSWIIWGRIPQDHFQAWKGKFSSESTVELIQNETKFTLTLAPNGLIQGMVKQWRETVLYEVQIRDYTTNTKQVLPRRIQVVQKSKGNRLVLVMSEINEDEASTPFPGFQPPEGLRSVY